MVNKKKVLKQLAKGMSVSECARRNECSRAYIQKVRKQNAKANRVGRLPKQKK